MSEQHAVEFVGAPGPGAVINQYLPQPGQHVGRRMLRIDDLPDDYWRDSAPLAGTPWRELLGLAKSEDGVWELRRPENLTSTWFSRRAGTRQVTPPALRRAEVALTASARAELDLTGSLRNWTRGGTSSAARMSTPDHTSGGDPPPPGGSSSGSIPEPPAYDEDEGEAATTDFHHSLGQLEQGTVAVPSTTWGGLLTEVEVDLDQPPEPALVIVQVLGISSFLGDYGLGRTVKTLSLLPGENLTMSTRTWRASSETIAQGSSIIDSVDDSAVERFAETVMSETTDTATRSETESWYVDAEAQGSIGIASASVSGGGAGEYTSGTEAVAKAVDESVREHTAEASSHRENTVTSSSERTVSTEDEEVIERSIKNINVGRVLNFTVQELNQAYVTKTHLLDVRVAFGNGNPGSWREEPISRLRQLVEEVVAPQHVDTVCSDILGTIAVVYDIDQSPVGVLEQVRLDDCGVEWRVQDARPSDNCQYPPPTADGRLYYRFKRGPLGQGPGTEHPVEGVPLKERTIVMATDSVAVEALLGREQALDPYSQDLQVEAIREKQLANDREQLAQRIVAGGDADLAALYAQVFAPAPEPEPVVEPVL
jgi:hypothetical protein